MNRNKILFFPGLLITTLGSILFAFASGLYLLQKTGRSDIFAGNILVSTLPIVFASVFFGKVIDNFSKKKLLVIADILNGLLMFLVLFLWGKANEVYLIYTASLLTTVFGLLVTLTFQAGKPELFNKEELVQINSISSIIQSASGVLGPVLGGVILSFYDIKAFIFLNGISFFVSAIAEFFLVFKVKINVENEEIERDVKEEKSFLTGLRYIKNSKNMKDITLLIVIANIGFAFVCTVPFPYLIINHYKFSNSIYGGVMGMLSVGMILGSFLVSKFKIKLEIKSFITIYSSLGILAIILSSLYIFKLEGIYLIGVLGTGALGVGLSIPFIDIPLITFLQSTTPEKIRGQIIGSFISIVKTILPLSLLISGKIVDKSSPFLSIVLGGGIFFLGTYLSKRISKELI